MNNGVPIPASAHDLLDAAVPCVLTWLRPGGEPDSVYVWCGRDGDELSVNAGDETVWLRHIRRDPRVSLVVVDPEDVYHYVSVRGTVVAIDADEGYAHIDALSWIYEGTEEFAWARPEDGARHRLTIRPDRVRVYRAAAPPER
jgi:PPOX class probable F420-dependent enzyme